MVNVIAIASDHRSSFRPSLNYTIFLHLLLQNTQHREFKPGFCYGSLVENTALYDYMHLKEFKYLLNAKQLHKMKAQ